MGGDPGSSNSPSNLVWPAADDGSKEGLQRFSEVDTGVLHSMFIVGLLV